ncbi:hypothetical protein MBLNU230_g6222t1 [Neophaeotheca triangularis]
MAQDTNSALVEAAEKFLAAAKKFDGDPLERMALTKQADNLRYHAEDGFGTIMRQWDQVHLTAALNIVTSTGILQNIPQEGTATSKQLAAAVDLEESVVQRAMRVICAQGIAEEVEPNVYRHNSKSLVYVTGTSKYFFKMLLDQDFAFKQIDRYFKTHSREDILDRTKNPYGFAHGLEGKTYYEVISADPERFEAFNQTLVQMDSEMPVRGMFPFDSMKAQVEAEPERPFIVDIGAGMGKVLMSIMEEAPGGFGAECILQDRPDVLAAIPDESIPGVKKMEHDFFTPQPVKNAHLYLLRRILHDFYEEPCVEILKNVASAMGPTSRLLVGDFVVPDRAKVGDDFMIYWMDLSMMMLTGKEKTQKQFEELFAAAGLELLKVWPFAVGAQSIVEARLKR